MDRLVSSACADFSAAGFKVEQGLVHRFVASLLTKRFVILTGLSGSGKTKLAQALGAWLTSDYSADDDWVKPGDQIPSDRVFYHVDAVDVLAIQFSNERPDGQRIKVTLPRELIGEWARAIRENDFTRETTARVIRETVASTTTYSTQLNSFETHLKAAAFALLESEVGRNQPPEPAAVAGYEIVAVGADWNSNEHILGYPDALHPTRYARTQALDLILRALANPTQPFFLILDEMNLSHVERYFADILSAIESGESIHLYGDTELNHDSTRDGVPRSLKLPRNLFIVGTVNVDETTYMFSPKVLDRANTIEFRIDDGQLGHFLRKPMGIDLSRIRGKGRGFAGSFLESALRRDSESPASIQARINDELRLFFRVMADHGFEFGFRTALEISRFAVQHRLLSPNNWSVDDAMDAQVYQKILPRLNGSRARLEPVLQSLIFLCTGARNWTTDINGVASLANMDTLVREAISAGDHAGATVDRFAEPRPSNVLYPLSITKLERMHRLLRQNGFTSFAEA